MTEEEKRVGSGGIRGAEPNANDTVARIPEGIPCEDDFVVRRASRDL